MPDNNKKQSRKRLLVINNPADYSLDHEAIAKILHQFKPLYFCMADEIASTGTPHTHVYIQTASPVRFSTIKKRFPMAHIETAYGTAAENRDYIRKEGKWADSEKAETVVPGSFFEWGTLPMEQEEKIDDKASLIALINIGMSTAEIIKTVPKFALRVREVEALRQTILSEKYADHLRRDLEVNYIFGETGAGKTRSIYAKHSGKDICRITDYSRAGKGPIFDAYTDQNVLVFEEFHGQIPIGDMLNYLDIYPLSLPARYNNRIAQYHTVYLTSNLPLDKQYWDVQQQNPEVWNAFLRRIHHIAELLPDGSTKIIK